MSEDSFSSCDPRIVLDLSAAQQTQFNIGVRTSYLMMGSRIARRMAIDPERGSSWIVSKFNLGRRISLVASWWNWILQSLEDDKKKQNLSRVIIIFIKRWDCFLFIQRDDAEILSLSFFCYICCARLFTCSPKINDDDPRDCIGRLK